MKNDFLELECTDITVDGQGVCKKDGLVVFVKEMIPGEKGRIKIIAEKKNYAYGIIDELTVSSPYRIMPDCPIAYKCGGCDYRYIDYGYQLVLKKRVLEATFRNMGLDVEVKDIVRCDDPFFYRNKVQVPVKDHKFGFYRKFSNDIVEFDRCYIQTKLANEVFNDVRKLALELRIDTYIRHILIKHAAGTGEVMLGLIVRDFELPFLDELVARITDKYSCIKSVILNLNDRDDNVILGQEERVLYGRDHIIDEFDGLRFKIAFKSFYQVNYHQMQKLYGLAKQLAEPDTGTRLLDLFSGIGTISLYMARYCREVCGVEIVKEAVDNARDNARMNGIDNATFYLDDARADLGKYLKDKDIVIVDPPRKGLNKSLIDSIIDSGIPKVVYISCNPATLARDLAQFKEHYDFSAIHPVDMFPFTTHVETVCCLYHQKKDFISVPYEPNDTDHLK
ncbi:MAG: 23S rRNA (uracil(1939)-C(5))-methyltransferase RlmD [Erysipelotrichaceae bacterium]|nr:23S rRNA (uracil(1939)-C(5))-methyltransferase RlmD [Erysipelotrichaceae bacterium]